MTIGSDAETANALESLGAKHVSHNVDEIEVDPNNKIVSTPAYMLGPNIASVAIGIEKLVNKVISMV